MPPQVFIVILQYNHSQDTIRCLDSVKELVYQNYQVVVVDNASESSEKNHIKNYLKSQLLPRNLEKVIPKQGRTLHESYPQTRSDLAETAKIILIENEKNLGYAGGNNVGIRYALEHGADYVFILNNDTTVQSDLLDKLIAVAESDPQVGIVGPAIKEGSGQTAFYGKISWLKTELKHSYQSYPLPRLNLGRKNGSVIGPNEYVIGAAMLIKREVLEKIDGFDEVYFLYFEDADLCLRAQLAGYKLKIAPETTIYHQVSASTSSLGKPLILRYHMRNALIFNSLNAPWPIKFFLIGWSAYILLKNFLKVFLFPAKVADGEAIIDGVLDFYKNRYGKI